MSESKAKTDYPTGDRQVIEKINKGYEQTLASLTPENRQRKERLINDTFRELSQKIVARGDFDFTEERQVTLRLKLARYFQREESLDPNTLFDALIETPKFIDKERGSLLRLLEIHQEKTLQRIAEARKRRAEVEGKGAINPWENLFTTQSGNYYVARLLNMPHLEMESEYMRNCVGTSDSYVNRIKKGEIEILSFRNVPKINPRTQKLEGDTPIITIEYDLKARVIRQMKKQGDKYLSSSDPYYKDVINALKELLTTKTDTGRLRDFVRIEPSELGNINVGDYKVLTDKGEVSFRDFNPEDRAFVFKYGEMPITSSLSSSDVARIVRIVEGLSFRPEEIARSRKEVTPETKVYIGNLFPDFFKWLPDHIEHIYASFPEGKVNRESVMAGGRSVSELKRELKRVGDFTSYVGSMMESKDFVVLGKAERIDLVRLKVRDLGLTGYPTTDEIFQRAEELGLELCPPEVGPEYLLQNSELEMYEWRFVGMKPIAASDGGPSVFKFGRGEDSLWLYGPWALPASPWDPEDEFVFRLRK